jgi:hypothetical protein
MQGPSEVECIQLLVCEERDGVALHYAASDVITKCVGLTHVVSNEAFAA